MGNYSKLIAALIPQLLPVALGLLSPETLQMIIETLNLWVVPIMAAITGAAVYKAPANAGS